MCLTTRATRVGHYYAVLFLIGFYRNELMTDYLSVVHVLYINECNYDNIIIVYTYCEKSHTSFVYALKTANRSYCLSIPMQSLTGVEYH